MPSGARACRDAARPLIRMIPCTPNPRARGAGEWSDGQVMCREVVGHLHLTLAGAGTKFRQLVDVVAHAQPSPLSILKCLRLALLDPTPWGKEIYY